MDVISITPYDQLMVAKNQTFAERFDQLRDGMSFQALSDAIYRKTGTRITAQGMHKWTRGGKIEPANLKLISDFFGVNESWLLFGEGDQSSGPSLEDAITDLGPLHGQAVLDFLSYKIESADALMAREKAAHYVAMIAKIKADMQRRKNGGNDT